MKIRFLNKKTELDKVKKFIPFPVFENEFPGHTLCAVDNDEIVGVASVRLMEGDICYLDSIATDPKFDSQVRNEALALLAQEIFELAKALGFKKMWGSTRDEGLKKRALSLGFKDANQTLYIKEL